MRLIHFPSSIFAIILLAGCITSPVQEATLTTQPTSTPTEAAATPLPTETSTPRPTMAPKCVSWEAATKEDHDFGWWNEVVFYELFVRSFFDSDSDGIGDFNGIVQKLDYLNDGDPETEHDLGIKGIWLMPINPSPSYHGYDVSDYYDVNPEYGTMEEFKNLLNEAHQRGIRVIIDLVLNHTSTKHPWFQEASADPESQYRDYYIWTESPPGFKSPWGTDVWHSTDTGFYYGIFWVGMPDLNYKNPQVTAEMQEVIRFWLEDVGVDGYRLDAIKHLIENGEIQENTLETHNWWEGFYDYYTSINPDAFTIGEAWTSTNEVVKYVGDEVNIAFEFDTAGAILTSARTESNHAIQQAHQIVLESYPPHQFGTFITNHDQGRVMTELRNKSGQAKAAASLLLTGPGVPFLYYGEEIGQRGGKPDENIRTPMQWSAEKYAGFTDADLPWQRPQDDFEEKNVESHIMDPESLLSHYRTLIHARNQQEALKTGQWLTLPTSERSLYAFLRYTEAQTLLVLINLSQNPIEDYRFCLTDGPFTTGQAVEILQNSPVIPFTINDLGGFDNYKPIEVLNPYSTYIIDLK